MRKIGFLFLLLLVPHILVGFDVGMGFSYNTIDETFTSDLHTNEDRSGRDRYEASSNRLAPTIQLGQRFSLQNGWQGGLLAEWKYLNYKTPNVNSSRGQILPNATFSSINIFGPAVIRDFTSKTRLHNEVLLLGYLGKQITKGYAYLGLGPAILTAANSIYVSSVHIPNGVGDHLISTSVTSRKTIWAGAAQAGYQYFLCQGFFVNISYTYLQSARTHFHNSANTAILNGADNPGPTTLFLRRAIQFSAQELMLAMNLTF